MRKKNVKNACGHYYESTAHRKVQYSPRGRGWNEDAPHGGRGIKTQTLQVPHDRTTLARKLSHAAKPPHRIQCV